MARSLVVKHEEATSTSPLFTGFLLACVALLVFGSAVAAAEVPAPEPRVSVSGR